VRCYNDMNTLDCHKDVTRLWSVPVNFFEVQPYMLLSFSVDSGELKRILNYAKSYSCVLKEVPNTYYNHNRSLYTNTSLLYCTLICSEDINENFKSISCICFRSTNTCFFKTVLRQDLGLSGRCWKIL
jgi:hypothetical protein